MPKGVEHIALGRMGVGGGPMPTSVMPKGVEHTLSELVELRACYAHLCDAERR